MLLFFLSALFPDSFWTCAENPKAVLQRERQELDKVVDQLETARLQRDNVLKNKDVAESQLKKLKAELTPLAGEVVDLQTRVKNLTDEKANQTKTGEALQADVDTAIRKNAELLAKKTKLAADSEALAQEQAEVLKAKEALCAAIAGHQTELDTAQTILSNSSRLLRSTFEANLTSLACVGATVMNQPTLALDQLQLALGWYLL